MKTKKKNSPAMAQNHSLPSQEITCESVTEEIVASYAEQGYTLTFAEEVMRYDLSHTLPHVVVPPAVSYLTWSSETIHHFFTAYEAAFRERPGFPAWSEEAWIRWTTGDPTFRPDLSYLALAQHQSVGFITNDEDEERPGPIGWINQVGVHPRWRRQGLGAALITRALQAWKEAAKEDVMLHVNINNPGAIHLYQQLGFVVIGRRGKFRK
jgi:mycothiol synthase